ncbi:MAG: RDD family protein [Anaerolineales bacterium]|nr:RDD family protein [Anaerolineales bacterium]
MEKKKEPQGYLGYYAGFISRLVAFFVDMAAIAISFTVIVWLFTVTATMMQFRTILGFSLRQFPQIINILDKIASPAVVALMTVIYSFGYFIFFWSMTGQTVGNAFLGLRIVTTQGRRVPIWRAALRLAGYVISFATLFLGFLWIVVDNRRQGLHDKIAGTYVIYSWDALPDEQFLADLIVKFTGRHQRRQIPENTSLDTQD